MFYFLEVKWSDNGRWSLSFNTTLDDDDNELNTNKQT